MSNIPQLKTVLEGENLKRRFNEVLGAKSTQFIASILTTVGDNKLLEKCDFQTIVSASMVAATLDLPINPNLGFAYIIPYGARAQFQIGYKGIIQLAQRTGKYKTINVSAVKEGEISTVDFLTGQFEFNWNQDFTARGKTKTIGYVAYFELLDGFSKSFYMTIEEIGAHAKKFSKTVNHKNSPWVTSNDSMSAKTVLKLLVSKYGPMSTDMQQAIVKDQSVTIDDETTYPDNPTQEPIQDAEIIEEKKEGMRSNDKPKIDLP